MWRCGRYSCRSERQILCTGVKIELDLNHLVMYCQLQIIYCQLISKTGYVFCRFIVVELKLWPVFWLAGVQHTEIYSFPRSTRFPLKDLEPLVPRATLQGTSRFQCSTI